MISIREMTAADEGAVMEMVDRFYHSPAVEHEGGPGPFSAGPFRRRWTRPSR